MQSGILGLSSIIEPWAGGYGYLVKMGKNSSEVVILNAFGLYKGSSRVTVFSQDWMKTGKTYEGKAER